MSRTFAFPDDHKPESLFHGHDNDQDGEAQDATAARVALRYAGAMFRTRVPEEAIVKRSPAPKVTTGDVIAVLNAKGIDASAVEWLHPIDEHQVEFVGRDTEGVEQVRGLVVVKAAIEDGAVAVHADVELLDDGDIPF